MMKVLILLVNPLQSSRSTFSRGSFLSFFAFKEGMSGTPSAVLGGWPTVSVLKLMGEVNTKHLLQAQAPEALLPGPVRIILQLPEAEDVGEAWMQGIAREWAE